MFIYFIVRESEHLPPAVKIGTSSSKINLQNRIGKHLSECKQNGIIGTLHSIILGTQNDEGNIHRYFKPNLQCDEIFTLTGELIHYMDWLGRMPFAANSLEELETSYIYPTDLRFPFTRPWTNINSGGIGLSLDRDDYYLRPMTRYQKCRFALTNYTDEWYTPRAIIESVEELYGGTIDLDPASCGLANSVCVHAVNIFTQSENGLLHEWCKPDGRPAKVFCNPPYGAGMNEKFILKGISEYKTGNCSDILFLLNQSAAHTNWWQPLWEYPVCIFNGRVNFISPPEKEKAESPRNGSAMIYLGNDIYRFETIFSKWGKTVATREVWERSKNNTTNETYGVVTT